MNIPNINPTENTSSAKQQQAEKVQQIAERFEAIFVKMMFKEMTETLDQSFFGNTTGNHIYQGIFEDKLVEHITENGNMGVQDKIKSYIYNRLSASGKSLAEFDAADDKVKAQFMMNEQVHFQALMKERGLGHTMAVPTSKKADNYNAIIAKASAEYNVPENVIRAVIKAESNGDPNAVSRVGAKGLMQLMDATAKELNVSNSFNPEQNIFGGTKYLAYLLKQYDGNLEKSLAAYNAGPHNVDKYNGIPPFKETQNYVKKIMKEINNEN